LDGASAAAAARRLALPAAEPRERAHGERGAQDAAAAYESRRMYI
jgi:hypothetical protein